MVPPFRHNAHGSKETDQLNKVCNVYFLDVSIYLYRLHKGLDLFLVQLGHERSYDDRHGHVVDVIFVCTVDTRHS